MADWRRGACYPIHPLTPALSPNMIAGNRFLEIDVVRAITLGREGAQAHVRSDPQLSTLDPQPRRGPKLTPDIPPANHYNGGVEG